MTTVTRMTFSFKHKIRIVWLFLSIFLKNEDASSPRRKRVWKKSHAKVEVWKGRRFSVIRSSKGTFVKVHKIRAYHYRQAPKKWAITATGRKSVALYGRTLSNRTGKVKHNRIEIIGKGKDLYDALAMIFGGHYVPRRPYQHVDAEELEEYPEEYLEGGEWIDRDVKS